MLKIKGMIFIGKRIGDYEIIRSEGESIEHSWYKLASSWLHIHNQKGFEKCVIVYPQNNLTQYWIITQNEPGQDGAGRLLTISFVIKTEGELIVEEHIPTLTRTQFERNSNIPDMVEADEKTRQQGKLWALKDTGNSNPHIARLLYGENTSTSIPTLCHILKEYPTLIKWIAFLTDIPFNIPDSKGVIIPQNTISNSIKCTHLKKVF